MITLSDPEVWAGEATLTVIEWKLQNVSSAIFLCDGDDRVVDEVDARIQAPGSEFTAYLKWDGFSGNDPIGLEDDTDTPRGRLIAAAREALREHLAERLRLQELATIQRWRDEGVWPYKDEPKTPIEAATRDTFNVVAMAASRTVDESKSGQSKALSLRLLKETFESDPEALLPILTDVARLPRARIEELTQILKHTTLAQLIQTGREIGSRMEFLSGLNTILFDRQIKKRLLERRQLHRILAHETWIFGEEWSLTGDDERLTKVLKKFLSKLGQDVELADLKEVRLEDGSDAIPDLVLGRRLQTTPTRSSSWWLSSSDPSTSWTMRMSASCADTPARSSTTRPSPSPTLSGTSGWWGTRRRGRSTSSAGSRTCHSAWFRTPAGIGSSSGSGAS